MNDSHPQMDQTTDRKTGTEAARPTAALPGGFWRWIRVHYPELLCAGLLTIMGVQMLAAISRKTITVDETIHIPAGYYHLVTGDFQINNEHPPLVKMWAALPLLLIQPAEPPAIAGADENYKNRTWSFHQRFWEMNRARFDTISFWPRVMMIVLTLALGTLIFFYARKLFGATAAVFAVALFSLEPTVLAHGRVVHTDVPAALAYLLFFIALHRYWEARTIRRAVVLGVISGFALLTKFSLLLIVPVLVAGTIFLLIRAARKSEPKAPVLLHAVLVLVIVFLSLNLAYRFQHPALVPSDVAWVQAKSAPHVAAITLTIGALSKIVPTYYLFGIYNVGIHNQYGHPASLLGMHSDMGWWYYFPAAFALKTTLPFLLLSIAAVGWALGKLLVKREKIFLFLLAPFGLYAALAMSSHLDIGIRYFLPAYPFLFILGGVLLARISALRVKPLGVAVVALLLAAMVFEAARTFPDYMPYMNQLASRHPHWWYLSDSNVEWGDDVGELAAYLKARGETRVRAALSGGPITLIQYNIEYVDLLPANRGVDADARYTAIGAAFLNGSVVAVDERIPGRRPDEAMNYFAAYRERKPEAVFGNSIYLFREHD
jgi:hypothetical protein